MCVLAPPLLGGPHICIRCLPVLAHSISLPESCVAALSCCASGRRNAVIQEVLNSAVQTGDVHCRLWLNTSSWSSLGIIADTGDACGLREKNSGSLSRERASAEEFCSLQGDALIHASLEPPQQMSVFTRGARGWGPLLLPCSLLLPLPYCHRGTGHVFQPSRDPIA